MEISFKQKSHNPVDKKEGQKKTRLIVCLFSYFYDDSYICLIDLKCENICFINISCSNP